MHVLQRILTAFRRPVSRRAALAFVMLAFVPALVAFLPERASACGLSDIGGCVASLFVWIFTALTSLMGFILILLVDGLIRVAQYWNFVSPGPTAVQIGWIVTRDLANMIVILILLVLAFGTIINVSPKYHWRGNLLTLLLTAIAINFSKTICGLFIDLGQVVMLTFVNGFREAAGGNFMNAFQIPRLLDLDQGSPDFGLVLGMMLAFILVTVACSVVLVMLVMMVYRFVALWVLIIMAPLAWMTKALPSFGSTYSDWWAEFKRYVVAGPKIAFFLWLALASVQRDQGNVSNGIGLTGEGSVQTASQGEIAAASEVQQGGRIPTAAGRTDTILSLVIVTAILFAGLKEAQKSGVAGASLAGTFDSWFRKQGKRLAMAPVNYAGERLAEGGRGVLGMGQRGTGGLLNTFASGVRRIPIVGGALSRPFNALGTTLAVRGTRTGEELEAKRKKRREQLFGSVAERERARNYGVGDFMKSELGVGKPGKDQRAEKRKEDLRAILGDKKASKALGSDKVRSKQALDMMDQARKKKPSDNGLYQDTLRKFWKNGSADQQKEAWGIFKADEAAELTADDFKNGANVGAISSDALAHIQKNGTTEQKAGLAGYLNSLDKKQLGDFYRKKKVSETDIPADILDQVPAARGYVLDGIEDNRIRREIMADPKKADIIKEAMGARLAGALPQDAAGNPLASAMPDAGLAQLAVDAISVGTLDAERISGDERLKNALGGSLDVKALASQVNREDPQQLAAAQEAMRHYLSSNEERAKKIQTNENYQHIMPEEYRRAGKAAAATAAAPAVPAAPKTAAEALNLRLDAALAEARAANAAPAVAEIAAAIDRLKAAVDKQAETEKKLATVRSDLMSPTDVAMRAQLNATLQSLKQEIKGINDDMTKKGVLKDKNDKSV